MKKQAKKLKLAKETLNSLTSVVGAYPSDVWECYGSAVCPPPDCPTGMYASCIKPIGGASHECEREQ